MKTVEKLALHGGPKTISKPFKRYNPIGKEEVVAAKKVVESGVLSKFLGCWDPDFYGGPMVQKFERACEKYFGVKHAVTVNSWTSGLITAIGAIGIEPGDEVIVSPWTMCASATAILHWNAIPVFADIEPNTFCIDPRSIEANITPQTRAIMAVDIFGQSADMDAIMKIASKHKLKVISDTAQAPGALYKKKYAGTIAHVGGYSLNYHKHIHTGEGGILVTNDKKTAERMQLIRNHAEAVVADKGVNNLSNMVGYNFRLGEIESAIGIEQIKKLKRLVRERQKAAKILTKQLSCLPGLKTPVTRKNCTHAYYVYPLTLNIKKIGVRREQICKALIAEGIKGIAEGYQTIHLLPLYQKKIAFGSKGFPWKSDLCKRSIDYSKGICPVAEKLNESSFVGFSMCLHRLKEKDVNLVAKAFTKVWSNLQSLR